MTFLLPVIGWFTGSTIGRYVGLGLITLVLGYVILRRASAQGKRDLQLQQAEQSLDIIRERLKHVQDLSSLTREQRVERLREWSK